MEPSLKTEAPGLHGTGQAPGPQAWPGTSLPHPAPRPGMYSRKSYVAGAEARPRLAEEGRREGGSRLKRRKQEGWWWGAGQDRGRALHVARVGAQTQVGWCPEDLRAGVRSLWGLAGQLLLVEAHDMVHKLVLLACLDHAAPGGRDTRWTWGCGRMGCGGAPPNP